MKRVGTVLICALALSAAAGSAGAAEPLLVSVAKGCEKELTTYCSEVTPGEGRVLACLYAHGDKISGRCEYALYDAAAQLERFVAALSYVAGECEDDLEKYCGSVQAGQGRLAECLLVKNKESISSRCSQALDDVELTYEE
jgi:hypothetical protein